MKVLYNFSGMHENTSLFGVRFFGKFVRKLQTASILVYWIHQRE